MARKRVCKPRYCVILYLKDMVAQVVPDKSIHWDKLTGKSHYVVDYKDKKSRQITPHAVHLWSTHSHTTSGYKDARMTERLLIRLLKRKLYPQASTCVFCSLSEELENTGSTLELYVKSIAKAGKRSASSSIPPASAQSVRNTSRHNNDHSEQPGAIIGSLPSAVCKPSAGNEHCNLESEADDTIEDLSSNASEDSGLYNKASNLVIDEDVQLEARITDRDAAMFNLKSQNALILSKLERLETQNATIMREMSLLHSAFGTVTKQVLPLSQACTTLRNTAGNLTEVVTDWGRHISAIFNLTTQIARHVEATNATVHERRDRFYGLQQLAVTAAAGGKQQTSSSVGTVSLQTVSSNATPCSAAVSCLLRDPPNISFTETTSHEDYAAQTVPADVRVPVECRTAHSSEQDEATVSGSNSAQAAYNKKLLKTVSKHHAKSLRESTAVFTAMESDPESILICQQPLAKISVKAYKKLYGANKNPQRFFLKLLKAVMIDQLHMDVSGYSYSGAGAQKGPIYKDPVFVGLLRQIKAQYPEFEITEQRGRSITDWCRRQQDSSDSET